MQRNSGDFKKDKGLSESHGSRAMVEGRTAKSCPHVDTVFRGGAVTETFTSQFTVTPVTQRCSWLDHMKGTGEAGQS